MTRSRQALIPRVRSNTMASKKRNTPQQVDGEALESMLEALTAKLVDEGLSDREARKALNLSEAEYAALRRELVEREKMTLTKRTASDVYVDYCVGQRACLSQLQVMVETLKGANQPAAALGALKAMSDIHDRIVKVGQDLGIVDKRAAESRSVNLHVDATVDEIRASVAKEIKATEKLMRDFGGGDFAAVQVPVIHRPDPVAAPLAANSTKVHKGRFVEKDVTPLPGVPAG